MSDKDKIVLVDEKKDAETFVDNRPPKKELAVELHEKGIEIDLSDMSYEDVMQMSKTQAMFSRLPMLQERMALGDHTAAQLDELLYLSDPSTMEKIFLQARQQMAKVVKKLPETWFVSDAPPDLPLNSPDTYKWLRSNRARELRAFIQRVENEAKN